jgi:peptidoglycan/xylan/chitin deacetylase (PgdA/CDA1 family)
VASFFLVGEHITKETAPIVKRAFAMGCEIGNHSNTHACLSECSREEILAEILPVEEKVQAILGRSTKFFRPPYLATSPFLEETVEKTFVFGDGCEDYLETVSAKERARRVLSQAKADQVILLHDMEGNTKTVDALREIVPGLLERAYQFVTVGEVLL